MFLASLASTNGMGNPLAPLLYLVRFQCTQRFFHAGYPSRTIEKFSTNFLGLSAREVNVQVVL